MISAASSTSIGRAISAADRFTCMNTSRPSARNAASVSADFASITGAIAIQSVSPPMPTSVSGPTSCPSGARNRASASKPATSSVLSLRIGWNTGSTLLSP